MFLGICNAVIILTISRPTIVSGEYRSGLFSFDDYESKVGDQNAVDSEECTARLLECLEKDTCDSQICKKEINSNQRIKSQLENWKKRPDVEDCRLSPCVGHGTCISNKKGQWICTVFDDCLDAKSQGVIHSTAVSLRSDNGSLFRVRCDMETDGGGWIVFQRRINNKTDFNRNWIDYRSGFGSPDSNFWLGLNNLHYLTNRRKVTLRIDLKRADGTNGHAIYETFKVGDEADKYRITIDHYKGNIGNAMNIMPFGLHNGKMFTTRDKNNNLISGKNCAVLHTGGWWFDSCLRANLNGLYGTSTGNDKLMSWTTWIGDGIVHGGLSFAEMKLR